jgi:hypothetical protein
MTNVKAVFPPSTHIRYCDDPLDAVKNAEALVV